MRRTICALLLTLILMRIGFYFKWPLDIVMTMPVLTLAYIVLFVVK